MYEKNVSGSVPEDVEYQKLKEIDDNLDNGISNSALNFKVIIIVGVILLLILAIIMAVVLGTKDEKDESGKKDNSTVEKSDPVNNTNPGVVDDKEQDGLKFTNTALDCSKTSSQLKTLVQNTTGSDIEVRIFDIIVKDKDGKTIVQLQGYVGGEVPSGEAREIVSNVDMDLINATDIEYKLVR